jgi:hypothetical protein
MQNMLEMLIILSICQNTLATKRSRRRQLLSQFFKEAASATQAEYWYGLALRV